MPRGDRVTDIHMLSIQAYARCAAACDVLEEHEVCKAIDPSTDQWKTSTYFDMLPKPWIPFHASDGLDGTRADPLRRLLRNSASTSSAVRQQLRHLGHGMVRVFVKECCFWTEDG